MSIDTNTGLLKNVKFIASPNFNEREPHNEIDLLVIHGISLPPGQFGGNDVEDFFTNTLNTQLHPFFEEIKDLHVSSHLLIKRTGDIIQFVPFTKRAWHAGVSSFCGREKCNDFSIGIELEGTDEVPYEPIQYIALADVTKALMEAYPGISTDRIVGHCDIAPGRKTDPGPFFEWDFYRQLLVCENEGAL